MDEKLVEAVADRLVKKLEPVIRAEVARSRSRWATLEEAKAYARIKSRETMIRYIEEGYFYGEQRPSPTGKKCKWTWVVDLNSIDDAYNSGRLAA